MCIYTYEYMYTYMYIYVYMYTYIYIYTYDQAQVTVLDLNMWCFLLTIYPALSNCSACPPFSPTVKAMDSHHLSPLCVPLRHWELRAVPPPNGSGRNCGPRALCRQVLCANGPQRVWVLHFVCLYCSVHLLIKQGIFWIVPWLFPWFICRAYT